MNIRETMGVSRLFIAVTIFLLVIFAVYFLVPLYVMLVNSFKPLSEIRAGNMLALPEAFSFDFWKKAWSTAVNMENTTSEGRPGAASRR